MALGMGRRALAGLAVAGLLLLALAAHAAPAHAAGPVTVSLTFDDGTASEYWARAQLSSHAMNGTFYVNTSRVGTSDYYMTWPQVRDLASDGNQIGGHTAMHVNLTATDPDEAKRQICIDRGNLVAEGLPAPTDFAYPYGSYNSSVEQWVRDCGYDSARSVAPATSETIPPADADAIRQGPGTDLTSLKTEVTAAENQGTSGWVPLVFHQICNACDSDWISQSDFSSFLDWLQTQVDGGAVVVKTVHGVIGGATQPPVDGPAPPSAPNGSDALRDASLENDASGDTVPDCWRQDSYGTNSLSWSRTSNAHTGSFAERVDVSNYQSGDAKLLPVDDLGFCTPTVTAGHQYVMTEWYESSVPVTFQAFKRSTLGAFDFWTSSQTFPASSTWAKATWTTPIVPAGMNGFGAGLAIAGNGSLTVDDAFLDDAKPTGGGDTTPPTVSVTSPTGGTVSGSSPIAVSASDNYLLDHVDVLIDGAKATTLTTGPYTYEWNSRTVANGTHAIAARAVDTAGNTTTTPATTVTVVNSNANLVSNPSLESATGSTPTCWLLGGFGNNQFSWTRTSDAHSGGFAENLNVTSLTDGDRKLVTVQDTGTCAVAAQPGHSYTVGNWYKTGLSGLPTIFAYYRNSAGTWTFWANSPRFLAAPDWTQATWSTPVLPAGATAISIGMGLNMVGSVTMDDFSVQDNSPPPDTVPPTSTITCNTAQSDSGGCITGYYDAPVPVSLTATDNQDGYGVASIRYTTDGSDPSLTNGTVYGGQFTVMQTTTVKYRAYDNAGNAEAVHGQLIRVDTSPPSSAIECNGGPCSSGFYTDRVSVSLSASDTGGSGVDRTVYTTDGSDPSTTNGTAYTGPFDAASTSTVKYRAYDNAGNAEAVNAQLIQIDTSTPRSSIACNGAACASTYYTGAVAVTLGATDTGGPGVGSIRYTTDGSDPSQTNGKTYAGAFSLTGNTTVKYRAYDIAGNTEPTNAQTIRVDVTAPASTIKCSGGSCAGWHKPTDAVSLSATDADSGVARIKYTTNGTSPSATNGTVYTAPFTLGATATVRYRAFDNAGNVEAVNVQQVQVDGTPPTASVTSPAPGSVVSGTVNVTAGASDNAIVDHVELLVDGATVATDSTSPYAFPWASTSVPDGTHTLAAKTVDGAGNTKTSSSFSVVVTNHNLVSNPSLETGTSTLPTCWVTAGTGTNSFSTSRTSNAHSGALAYTLSINSRLSGDRELVSGQDAGTCAPAATAGHNYRVSAWYQSLSQPVIFAYYRNGAGTWVRWTQSPPFPSSGLLGGYRQAVWTSPALPSGAVAISVGMGLTTTGSVTMDDFALFDLH